MSSTTATRPTTVTGHGSRRRPSSRVPRGVRPSTHATATDTASAAHDSSRVVRANSSPRAISAAVKTSLALTGSGIPPGTGCHGTSSAASTTNAAPAPIVISQASRRSSGALIPRSP